MELDLVEEAEEGHHEVQEVLISQEGDREESDLEQSSDSNLDPEAV